MEQSRYIITRAMADSIGVLEGAPSPVQRGMEFLVARGDWCARQRTNRATAWRRAHAPGIPWDPIEVDLTTLQETQ